jgi:plasmid maintenance system antidote protein VapI
MEARGWSLETMCEITGMKRFVIEEIIAGSRKVTPVFARQIGDAFGTGAELWKKLQENFENTQR